MAGSLRPAQLPASSASCPELCAAPRASPQPSPAGSGPTALLRPGCCGHWPHGLSPCQGHGSSGSSHSAQPQPWQKGAWPRHKEAPWLPCSPVAQVLRALQPLLPSHLPRPAQEPRPWGPQELLLLQAQGPSQSWTSHKALPISVHCCSHGDGSSATWQLMMNFPTSEASFFLELFSSGIQAEKLINICSKHPSKTSPKE